MRLDLAEIGNKYIVTLFLALDRSAYTAFAAAQYDQSL
jgi:hypothetical protein